jgi:hypothetical protein
MTVGCKQTSLYIKEALHENFAPRYCNPTLAYRVISRSKNQFLEIDAHDRLHADKRRLQRGRSSLGTWPPSLNEI